MKKDVKIDEVPKDARLAEDVRSGSGQVLLQKGTIINEELKKLLKNRGVQTVCIEDAPGVKDDSAGTLRAKLRERRLALLEEMFRDIAEDDVLMRKVHDEAALRAGVARFWEEEDGR